MAPSSKSQDSKKLFFDISGTVEYIREHDRFSGIQRVVSVLITEISKIAPSEHIFVSWYDKKSGKPYCAPFSSLAENLFSSPQSMRRYFFPLISNQTTLYPLVRYRDRPFKYYFHRTRLDLASLFGSAKTLRKYNLTASAWRALRFQKSNKIVQRDVQDFWNIASPGDLLVLLDLSVHPKHMEFFQKSKDRQLEICSMIYDLIPISHPHFTSKDTSLRFYDWMREIIELSDRFVAISDSSRRDLLTFQSAHNAAKDVVTVPLAQAPISLRTKEAMEERPLTKGINTDVFPKVYDLANAEDTIRGLVGLPFVLCVGPMDQRKNSWRIALAWKHLFEKGHTNLPKLVFAGRLDPSQLDFKNLLETTGNLFGHIHVIESPSDETLDLLYRECQFFIMASLYEGWGLPVGEGLAYGKTGVVAHNSSLPEVGGDFVEYCDAEDVGSIAQAVERVMDTDHRTDLMAKISRSNLRSWAEVAQDLKEVLMTET